MIQPRRRARETPWFSRVRPRPQASDVDVAFVGEPDPLTPLGAKGVGEIGLVGVAAAIAAPVYHATGRRIRALPITFDQLL